MPRSTCMKCGEVFKSVSSFDKHQVGNHSDDTRRCLSVDEMISQGMLKNEKGEWIGSIYDKGTH